MVYHGVALQKLVYFYGFYALLDAHASLTSDKQNQYHSAKAQGIALIYGETTSHQNQGMQYKFVII